MKTPYLLAALCALAGSQALEAFPLGTDLYKQPTSEPFIEYAGETVVTVNDSSGSISTAQTAINNARSANPSAILVINLTAASYTVTSSPLTLTSNECLVLGSGTTITASSSATAAALISVSGQSNVSIAGGTLNANGMNLNCIKVTTSNRVNVDEVVAENSATDCILMQGNGNTSFDNELTVTRCTAEGCTAAHYGISLKNATQAVVIDNVCSNNQGGGIYLSSVSRSTIMNNTIETNAIDGIHVASGDHNFICDNQMDGNPTGITLSSGSSANTIASNHPYTCSTTGINEGGTGDVLFENYYKGNTANFTSGGSGNLVMAYKAALSAPSQSYFYPPIFSNQHTTTTIVNGLGRYDLTIGATSIASVQSQYNSAVSAHPSDVIVLHLTGTTYTGGNTPLTLQSNTCVLLTGTIQMPAGNTATAAVTAASGSQYLSFSGGTIDGGGRGGYPAINFNGCGMVWIQGTTMQNFGVPTTRKGDGVVDLHSMSGPAMVSSCTINEAGGRGVWTEGSGAFVITDNTVSNCQMDGVDCDSHTQNALVKLNVLSGNVRYGVFFEQAASYNLGIGNTCAGGLGRGVNIYNNAETDITQYNTAACNFCDSDSNGLRSGSTGSGSNGLSVTQHNFFFNNTATNNTGDGIESDITGTQNYYSQTILGGNGTDIVTSGSEAFFNSAEP